MMFPYPIGQGAGVAYDENRDLDKYIPFGFLENRHLTSFVFHTGLYKVQALGADIDKRCGFKVIDHWRQPDWLLRNRKLNKPTTLGEFGNIPHDLTANIVPSLSLLTKLC